MRIQSDIVLISLVCLLLFCVSVLGADDSTEKECANDFPKVMACLDYAKGQATEPSKDCCSSVKGIKESKPKCLCFIIQQAHSGAQALKDLGVKEAKLLQLPTACQLQNASITNCPSLLGLSPSSPDAAIFANSSSSATPAGSGTSAAEKVDSSSSEAKHGACLIGPVMAIAIFICAFPIGSSSMLHSM